MRIVLNCGKEYCLSDSEFCLSGFLVEHLDQSEYKRTVVEKLFPDGTSEETKSRILDIYQESEFNVVESSIYPSDLEAVIAHVNLRIVSAIKKNQKIQIKGIDDAVVIKVVEFLKTPHPNKGPKMFEDLCFRMKNDIHNDISSILVDDLSVFYAYVSSMDKEMFYQVIRLALIMKIQPLTELLGAYQAQCIMNVSEKEIREQCRIPKEYQNDVISSLVRLSKNRPWAETIESHS
jgi:hypothetical protein